LAHCLIGAKLIPIGINLYKNESRFFQIMKRGNDMTKEKLIELIEDFIETNLEKQKEEEAKETKVTLDLAYKFANVDLKYILDFVKRLD